MQGKRSAIGSLHDSINFDYGSTSNNMGGIDQQICWNSIQNPAEAMLSEHHSTSGGSGSISQETRSLSRWNTGEPSSRNVQNFVNHNDRMSPNGWPSSMASSSEVGLRLVEHDCDQISVVSRNAVDLNLNGNQISNIASSDNGSTPSAAFASSSGSSSFHVEEEDNRPDYVLDERRLSCKRKNVEGIAVNGQSSSSASMWQALPPPTNTGNGAINASARLGAANPRLRLSIGGEAQDNGYVQNTGARVESSRRNYRVRVNPRIEQDSFPNPLVLPQVSEGLSDVAVSHRPVRYVPINPPGLQRNVQRLQGDVGLEQDLNSRPVPRSISEHPIFMPSVELRSSSMHNPTGFNRTGSTSRNVASSSQAAPGGGPQSSTGPTWGSHRQTSSASNYSRRLSGYVRRSLLSSAGAESGLHYGPASSSFQEGILPTGGGGAHSQGDGIPGIPFSLRSVLAAGGEGRRGLVSEHIRSVLDMMRRGEGLRFEDVMILDPSLFFGMADIHDEHRDMRLDIDNMSYEELLALEDRIGSVSTGLSEEKIVGRLKQKRYTKATREVQGEVEPCCICQEVYKNGEDIGALDCGHDFHAKCIKQWLQQKNSCPICKTTGLAI